MTLGIYCAGGAGRDLLDLTEQIGNFDTVVMIDDHLAGSMINGASVFSFADFQQKYPPQVANVTLASGESSVLRFLYERVTENGYKLQTLIHPSVWIPKSCHIGIGVSVLDRVRIGPNAVLSDCCHLSVNVAIGHGTTVGAFSDVSMGCMIAGESKIGSYTYVGANSCIRDGRSVGDHCIIGMGSVVLKDIPDHCLAYGNPAKVIRTLKEDTLVF